MSAYYCRYRNCESVQQPGSFLSFFSLPSDGRKAIWLKHSGDIHLQLLSKPIPTKLKFCEKHFYEKDIIIRVGKKELKPNAVPTPFDASICSCSEWQLDEICNKIIVSAERSFSNKKNALQKSQPSCSSSIASINNSISLNIDDAIIEDELVVKKSSNDRTYLDKYRKLDFSNCDQIKDIYPFQFPSPEKGQVKGANKKRENIPACLFKSPKKMRLNPQDSYEDSGKNMITQLLNSKTNDVKTFVEAQLFHKHGSRWNEKQKELGLKFYYKSPALYKELLKSGFALPAVSTILKWHMLLRFETGLNLEILQMLSNKLSNLTAENRRCILLFDEMHVKNELEYNLKDDVIYGFQDLGLLGRSKIIASSVLIVMLRGLNQNWKQVVGYVAGPIKGGQLNTIIEDMIRKLLSSGFDIIGITCDESSTNRLCMNKFEASSSKPYFFIDHHKIYTLYDVPHLFKCVRNTLLANDIIVEGNRISWNIIRKVYEMDNGTIRAMWKLTNMHVYPENYARMSVKLAMQSMSHSVSAAVLTAVNLGCFPNEEEKLCAINTATFIARINTLFDNLNSSNKYSKNPAKCAISEINNEVMKNLENAKKWIATWESTGRIKKPPCFHGILRTIVGLEMIWEDLKTKQNYIIPGHLNQDPCENVISMLREFKGTYEWNPSVYRIYRNLKQIMFHNASPSECSGYMDSQSKNLLCMEDYTTNEEKNTNVSFDVDDNDKMDQDIKEISLEMIPEISDDLFEMSSPQDKLKFASLIYFFGYFAKKFGSKCEYCSEHMINSNPDFHEKYTHIYERLYKKDGNTEKSVGSLTAPSSKFEAELKVIYTLFKEIYSVKKFEKKLLGSFLFPAIDSKIPQWAGCEHKSDVIKQILQILIRVTVRDFNKQLKTTDKKTRTEILKGM